MWLPIYGSWVMNYNREEVRKPQTGISVCERTPVGVFIVQPNHIWRSTLKVSMQAFSHSPDFADVPLKMRGGVQFLSRFLGLLHAAFSQIKHTFRFSAWKNLILQRGCLFKDYSECFCKSVLWPLTPVRALFECVWLWERLCMLQLEEQDRGKVQAWCQVLPFVHGCRG